MKKIRIALIVLVMLTGMAVSDEGLPFEHTAAWLQANLPADLTNGDKLQVSFAYGYVAGVAESAQGLGLICGVKDSTPREFAQVVQKYLSDHPTMLHQHRGDAALFALMEAYPCSKSNSGPHK